MEQIALEVNCVCFWITLKMVTTKAFWEAFERKMLLTLKALFENLDKFSEATIINHPKEAIQIQATTELDLQSDGLEINLL